jgi:hypothetical protein
MRSNRGQRGRSRTLSRIAGTTVSKYARARSSPMQRRVPPPNGQNAVGGDGERQRSGSNASGRG